MTVHVGVPIVLVDDDDPIVPVPLPWAGAVCVMVLLCGGLWCIVGYVVLAWWHP